MKMLRKFTWVMIALSLVMTAGMTGCKKKPRSGDLGGMSGMDPALGPLDGVGYPAGSMNPDDLQIAASQFDVVYFAYDSSQISGSERPKLEQVADYLRANPGLGLIVEGHCDERGSSEYNLALGERRAQAVRAYLIGLGIPADVIRTVSYGEEQPASFGHDEASWSKNRRASFSLYQ
jgi:peptidoglycan-associated lipoprotein